MSGIKHTPGPWSADPNDPLYIQAPDGDATPWEVARVAEHAGPGDATQANLLLVCAAPDLLEAAQMALEVCEYSYVRKALRAAISKATGEA